MPGCAGGRALELTVEARAGELIQVPPFVPHQKMNASCAESLECVVVRSGQEPIAVNLEIATLEPPGDVAWVDAGLNPRRS